jgi:hypothetical protein
MRHLVTIALAATLGALSVGVPHAIAAAAAGPAETHHYWVMVFTRPIAGKEAQFNAWYDSTHVPQMLEIPGFVAAARFHTLTAATPTSTLPPYLAVYDLDTTDLQKTNNEVKRRMTSGMLAKGEAMDYPTIATGIFEPITPRILAADLPGTTGPTQAAGSTRLETFELVVLSDPADGREQEFNDWYTTQHVPDVLHVPGFISGQRFKLVENDSSNTVIPHYLVKFEFQSYDLAATVAEINRRLRSGQTRMSTAMGPDAMVYFMSPLGPRSQAKTVNSGN